jgi:hypothetical protein
MADPSLITKLEFTNLHIDASELRAQTVQRRFAAHWSSLSPDTDVEIVPSVEETVARVREFADEGVSVFVTGGVHTVGGFLSVLEEDVKAL